jgi:hypothetical protein
MDPHKTTSELSAKIARGETLTADESQALDAAREAIMSHPDLRAAEAAIWDGIDRMIAESARDMLETIRRLADKLHAAGDVETSEQLRALIAQDDAS